MGFSLQEDGYQDAGAIEKGVSRRDVRDVKARVCRKDDNVGIFIMACRPRPSSVGRYSNRLHPTTTFRLIAALRKIKNQGVHKWSAQTNLSIGQLLPAEAGNSHTNSSTPPAPEVSRRGKRGLRDIKTNV